MKKIIFAMMLAATMVGCGQKQGKTAANEGADSTEIAQKADSAISERSDDYDFEAIAKAIDGCIGTYNFHNDVAGILGSDRQMFYIDLKGNRVEKPEEEIPELHRDWESESPKAGYLDRTGKRVLEVDFSQAEEFSDGMARVVDGNNRIGFINTNGELVIPCQYPFTGEVDMACSNFHEGYCWVVIDSGNDWYAFIDKKGKRLSPVNYSGAGDFNEGLAYVNELREVPGEDYDEHSGFIDKTGKMVIDLNGAQSDCFSDGVAKVWRGEQEVWFIDKTGKRLFDVDTNIIHAISYFVFTQGLAPVQGRGKYAGKYGFMDKKGRITFCLDKE